MAELIVIRHAQASFGAEDYDVLSDLGHEQSHALGQALALQGIAPDACFIGTMRRHRETFEGIAHGLDTTLPTPLVEPGLDEYDFSGLLEARHRDVPAPAGMHDDRKTHFRLLRDTVLDWQKDAITDPPESFGDFAGRVAAARTRLTQPGPRQVLAISSGGAISQMIAQTLRMPGAQQIEVQLQMRNCAVSRFIFSRGAVYLHSFNETPHISALTRDKLLTYS